MTLVITESATETAVDADVTLVLATTPVYGLSFFLSSVADADLSADLAIADVAMTAACGSSYFFSSVAEMDADAADLFSIFVKTAARSFHFLSTANMSPWSFCQGGIFYLCYAYIFTKIFSVIQEVIYGTKAARTNDTV